LIPALFASVALLAASPAQPAASAAPSPSAASSASPTPSVSAAPTPVRTAPPGAHSWQGITPGSPAATLHNKLGTPLLVRIQADGSLLDWYPGPTTNAYMIVREHQNIVQYVQAFPIDIGGVLDGLKDPYGVEPGFDYGQIKALRGEANEARQVAPAIVVAVYQDQQGFVWLYELTAAGVHAITLYDTHAPSAPPAQPVPDPHDGSSIGRAYVLHAHNEQEGARFEEYYATHRGGCSAWTVADQTQLSIGARKIDQLDLECVDTKDHASMFFDVTAFAGKT